MTLATTSTATSNLGAGIDRRRLVASAAAAAALALGGRVRTAHGQGGEVRIGLQKGSASLLVLKARGDLEGRLGELGDGVSWLEFTSGPPLLEAMNAGSIDFGTTGAPPPIFAQAAGTDLVYALATSRSPRTQAILAAADSPVQSPADLKGQQVAVAKGSSAHALLVYAVRQAGLAWEEIEPIYLQPADAKAAFEGGSVGAWSIWDPYFAAAQAATAPRVIADDESVGTPNRSFYLASRAFATERADALAVIEAALSETDAWADQNPAEVAKLVSGETGIPEEILRTVEDRRVYGLAPIDAQIVADQQALADLFAELDLIPEPIDVSRAFL